MRLDCNAMQLKSTLLPCVPLVAGRSIVQDLPLEKAEKQDARGGCRCVGFTASRFVSAGHSSKDDAGDNYRLCPASIVMKQAYSEAREWPR